MNLRQVLHFIASLSVKGEKLYHIRESLDPNCSTIFAVLPNSTQNWKQKMDNQSDNDSIDFGRKIWMKT